MVTVFFFEITNSANNRKVFINAENILRVEELATGKAQIQFQGSSINTVENYVDVKTKIPISVKV